MPRLHTRRNMPKGRVVQSSAEGLAVKELPFWVQPKGLDYRLKQNRLPKEYATEILNFAIRDGVLVVRDPVDNLGTDQWHINSLHQFMTSEGYSYLMSFSSFGGTGLAIWTGTTWLAPASTGTSMTGSLDSADRRMSMVSYGDKAIFSNGVDAMWQYDPGVGLQSDVEEGPAARYLTAFTGRVIASDVYDPNRNSLRIRWSVKNNYLDWTGLGSGYEDLLATPGGDVDAVMGVHPLTDSRALVLRRSSVWQMTETGLVDTPFRFSHLYDDIGTRSPYSAVKLATGLIFVANDQIYVMSASEIQPIGGQVFDQIMSEVDDPVHIVGAYDKTHHEYTIVVPNGADSGYVYQYNFEGQTWTRHEFPLELRWVTYADYGKITTPYDSLSGTFDAQTDSFDNWGVSSEGSIGGRLMFVTYLHDGFFRGTVLQEEAADADDDNGVVDISVTTPMIRAASHRDQTVMLEARLEYELDGSSDESLLFEYSINQGKTWSDFGTSKTISPTDGPTILRVRETVTAYNIQIRVFAASLMKLSILGLYVDVVKGKEVQDG